MSTRWRNFFNSKSLNSEMCIQLAAAAVDKDATGSFYIRNQLID